MLLGLPGRVRWSGSPQECTRVESLGLNFDLFTKWGFKYLGGALWGVPRISIAVFGGLHGSFPKQGYPNIDPTILEILFWKMPPIYGNTPM